MRILFFADSHLGIDYPKRRTKGRRYRGDDFFANFEYLLDLAVSGEFDLVIHGGDLFDRSQVPAHVVNRAYDRLFAAADALPIVLVPGNHDRSTLPSSLFLQHPNLHIFFEPDVLRLQQDGFDLQLAGFPFIRHVGREIEGVMHRLVEKINPHEPALLLMHQTLEGAQVGPHQFVFRPGSEVVSQKALPSCFQGYLSGHIHPHQILWIDAQGHRIPFIYPGSIETTSFAEQGESKGYITLALKPGHKLDFDFHPLPHRPLHQLKIPLDCEPVSCEAWLLEQLAQLEPRAYVRIASPTASHSKLFSAARLRTLARKEQILTIAHAWLREITSTSGPRTKKRSPA